MNETNRFMPNEDTKRYIFQTCQEFRAPIDENGQLKENAFDALAHYTEKVHQTKRRIAELESYNEETLKDVYEKWRQKELDYRRKQYEITQQNIREFQKLHDEITQWQPPSDLHVPLKERCLQHLTQNIEREQMYEKYRHPNNLDSLDMTQWLEKELKESYDSLVFFEEQKKEFETNKEETLTYIEQLTNSLA